MRLVALALVGLMLSGVAIGQTETKPKTRQAKLAVVQGWEPAVGLDANLVNPQGEAVYVACDSPAWTALFEALRARDQTGIDQLIQQKRVMLTPNTTPILLLKEFETRKVVAFDGVKKVAVDAATSWEVRIRDGEHKDKRGIASANYICKLTGTSEAASSSAKKAAKEPKRDSPAQKASKAYRAARQLEDKGSDAAAIDGYKQVIRDYPESDEARLSKARIKTLSEK